MHAHLGLGNCCSCDRSHLQAFAFLMLGGAQVGTVRCAGVLHAVSMHTWTRRHAQAQNPMACSRLPSCNARCTGHDGSLHQRLWNSFCRPSFANERASQQAIFVAAVASGEKPQSARQSPVSAEWMMMPHPLLTGSPRMSLWTTQRWGSWLSAGSHMPANLRSQVLCGG
jgi:hypothetical protein